MDPLSLTASVIAVATLAAQTARALADLRTLCKELPGRVHALSNEVSDIEVVLFQVAKVTEERSRSPTTTAETDRTTIPQLLKQAEAKLNELKSIIHSLSASSSRKAATIFRARLWRKEQPRLRALQEDIMAVKSSLNVIIGASNSREMMRVRLDLESLSAVTTESIQNQTTSWDEFLRRLTIQHEDVTESVSGTYQLVDQRISRVEEMLRAQSAQIQASQLAQIGPLFNMGPPPSRRRYSRAISKNRVPQMPVRGEAVGVRLTQYATVCRQGCLCACHSQTRSSTPGFMDRMLGQLFVGYAGMPLLSPPCDLDTCDKSQAPHVNVEYWFPLGFCWSQIIRLQLAYQPSTGPQISLSTLRRVPDSAACVSYALEEHRGIKNSLQTRSSLSSGREQ
ncbi:hypothetical protein BDZ45DRAFT_184563 [Acephala macrosclerotiorum]|nr:hypothetical protein BDZ45DRAFT_184563 [Acephala macrosclerotiorum]